MKIKYITEKRLSKPWLTKSILTKVREKSNKYKQYKLGLIDSVANNSYRNYVNGLIRMSKQNYFKRSFDNCRNDIKRTWSLIKKLLNQNTSKRSIKSLLVDGVEVTREQDIAECFNDYFCSIATSLDDQIPHVDGSPLEFLESSGPMSFFVKPLSINECSNIIKSLKNTYYGINKLPVHIIVKCSDILVYPLTQFINKSIEVGVFPDCLKYAQVTPVFKKGERNSTCNYRPISILPIFSKVFERCIADRILHYASKFSLFSKSQYGFLKDLSTYHALVSFTEKVYKSLDDKEHTIGVFIDLSKAFDTVQHKIMLDKLFSYGVRGIALSWFHSYLSNRQQCVKVGSSTSQFKQITTGVPQGSVLGPILFLLYVNDLPSVSTSLSSILFADDTTLLASHSCYQQLVQLLNYELKKIHRWTVLNRLSLNVSKTFLILFSNRPTDVDESLQVRLDDNPVDFVDVGRFLGVEVDGGLKFDLHINEICNKLSRTIGILYRLRGSTPVEVMINMYYGLVYPYIIYCVVVWGGSPARYTQKIILLQKKIIRIICNANYLAHTSELFKTTKILKYNDVYTYHLSVYMYKNRSNFSNADDLHPYDTRHRHDAVPGFHRLTMTQRAVRYRAASIWNGLPIVLKNCSSLSSFKKALKAHYISLY